MEKCSKCNGSGRYQNYGSCWKCGGTGKNNNQRGKQKYNAGDRIQDKQTNLVYEIVRTDRRNYIAKKYASDGKTLLSDLPAKLGKHITNYPEDSKEGYEKIN